MDHLLIKAKITNLSKIECIFETVFPLTHYILENGVLQHN